MRVNQYRCRLCDSPFCNIFQCRFYKDAEDMKQQTEEFRKLWAEVEAREANEQR